jgi:hypothetical protein
MKPKITLAMRRKSKENTIEERNKMVQAIYTVFL